jgi:hypothetical protein
LGGTAYDVFGGADDSLEPRRDIAGYVSDFPKRINQHGNRIGVVGVGRLGYKSSGEDGLVNTGRES